MTASRNDSNWQDILNRFAWDDTAHSGEAIRKRLQQRARQYAAPSRRIEYAAEDAFTALTFVLGGEHYGVSVMAVRSVRTIGRITRVPGTPSFYRGVVNVRGQVVTVMDLRLFFGIPTADDAAPPDELVVVRGGRLEIGLLAHNVEGALDVPAAAIEPVDNMRYALGVTRERLVLLDVERLLQDEQLVIGGHEEN